MKKLIIPLLVFTATYSTVYPQWVRTNGPYGGYVASLSVSGTNLFAGTTTNGVFVSTNNGTNWTEVNSGLANMQVAELAVSGANLFALTWGGFFLSTDSGTRWAAVNSLPTNMYVTCFAVSDTSSLFLGTAGTEGGVFLSSDNGKSLTLVNSGLPPKEDISALAISPDGKNIFAGLYGGGVFLSANQGTSWTEVNSGLPSNTSFFSFAFIGTNVFAAHGDDDVFLSSNNGTSWTQVSSLPRDMYLTTFAVSGSNLLAGTYHGGVFLSTDNGTTWTPFNSGLPPNTGIASFAVNGTNIFAGTGSGVWRRPLSEMITAVESLHEMPSHLILEQNYPNPCNPSTTIQFSIENSEFLILEVYDILGREVTTLVNEVKQPGTYSVRFDGFGLANGVYYYRIRTGESVQTKKLAILK